MWTSIVRYLPEFDSGVLTALDSAGSVFSLRCQPQPDTVAQVLRLSLPEQTMLMPSPGCLLFHKHDDRLWNLLSFAVRGTLERDVHGWFLHSTQFIPGVGIGGLMGYVRFLVDGRRTTNRYLRKRGLARPRIAWNEWQDVIKQAKEAG
jgi:hypothetical protein